MRSRVAGRTLSGSLKYFDTVGREMPLAAENSSIVLILGGRLLPRCFPTFADTPIPPPRRFGASVPPPRRSLDTLPQGRVSINSANSPRLVSARHTPVFAEYIHT